MQISLFRWDHGYSGPKEPGNIPWNHREVQEYLPFHELSYTAEIERNGTHFNLLAGYYGKYIIDFTPPQAEPSLYGWPGADLPIAEYRIYVPLARSLTE